MLIPPSDFTRFVRHQVVIFSLAFFIPAVGLGQTLTILDKTTLHPIQDVSVHNTSGGTYTFSDQYGLVNLSIFHQQDSLIFRHPSYQIKTILKSQLNGRDDIHLQEKIIHIEEVIVSANKWEQHVREVPNKIVSITPKEMAFSNAPTSADLLESNGQVFVQKSQLGGGSPMIRGFGANALLIVVDGVRMNNAIFRSGNLQNVINIDPNMLEGVEVIMGPGSVTYGSDALGGVMDFHTKEVTLSETADPVFNTAGMLRFSSASRAYTGQAQWNIANQKLGYFGGITFSKFGDLRSGKNHTEDYPDFGKRAFYVDRIDEKDTIIENPEPHIQTPTGYWQMNTIHKLKWQYQNLNSVEYILNLSTTGNIPRYDRLLIENNGEPSNAEWYYGPQKWMMNAIKFNFNHANKLWDQAKLTLSRQDFEESRHDRDFRGNWLRSRTENVHAYGLNFDADQSITHRHTIFYGIEYNYNSVASHAVRRNIWTQVTEPTTTRYPSGGSSTHQSAAYVSWKHKMEHNLIVNAGMRYSFVALHSRLNNPEFSFQTIQNSNGALNGNLGLVYNPSEAFKVSLMTSSGFRAPNVDDAAKVFDSEPGNVIVPNPGLQPEYNYNTEISMTKMLGDHIEVSVTAFHSWLRDAMVRSDFTFNGQDSIVYDGTPSNVQALTNSGRARIYGLDASMKFQITDQISLASCINETKGKDLVNDEPLRHVTPFFIKSALYYNTSKLRAELNVRYNGAVTFNELAPSEQNKPHLYTEQGALPWYTINLKCAYHLNQNLQFNVAVENILDRHYRPYSSGISAPGRNFVLSLKARY